MRLGPPEGAGGALMSVVVRVHAAGYLPASLDSASRTNQAR
jgi:hypothetical protein